MKISGDLSQIKDFVLWGSFGKKTTHSLPTIRTRRDLGRVRPWGDNMTAWRKKQIQNINIKLLSMPIIVNISLNLRMFCWIFYQSLCFLLTVIKELIAQFRCSF